MAALMLANGEDILRTCRDEMDMGMPMDMGHPNGDPISNTVEFPYGFPSSGRYRIFVQMKHGTTVETGAFDVMVE